MRVTQRVKKLLSLYESDNPGTKTNLARILMEGKLSGSGRVMILPIEGTTRSILEYPAGYDPQYHFQLAVDAGLSALAAPLGMLESAADTFAGSIPLILKMNSTAMLHNGKSGHGFIGSVRDALRLGCVGIGCTVEPGARDKDDILDDVRSIVEEAKSYGLAVVLWSSPGTENDRGDTALDNTAYAGHMASLMGAHMVCLRIPGSHFENAELTPVTPLSRPLVVSTLSDRVRYVRQSCLNGRRIVLFEGNPLESDDEVFEDIRGIRDGGGHGYVLPYNSLHRPFEAALQMLDQSQKIYQGKA